MNIEYSVIAREFNDLADLVVDILDRLQGMGMTNENLCYAVDDALIYTNDQWDVLKYYFTPNEPNIDLGNAMEMLIDDIALLLRNNGVVLDD